LVNAELLKCVFSVHAELVEVLAVNGSTGSP